MSKSAFALMFAALTLIASAAPAHAFEDASSVLMDSQVPWYLAVPAGASFDVAALSGAVIVGVTELEDGSEKLVAHVHDSKGHALTVDLPPAVVARGKLEEGDELTAQKRPSGYLLLKHNQPVAVLVSGEELGLTKSSKCAPNVSC